MPIFPGISKVLKLAVRDSICHDLPADAVASLSEAVLRSLLEAFFGSLSQSDFEPNHDRIHGQDACARVSSLFISSTARGADY